MKLSIVVPAYNEAENIAQVIRDIEEKVSVEHELVIVNDHSVDATADIVRQLLGDFKNLRLVENLDERGFSSALKTGFNNINTEIVVPVMADLCDDLTSIPMMLEKINAGYDIVCASRYIKGGARLGGPKIKAWLSCLSGWTLYYLIGIPSHDITNSFKMYRKKVIDSVKIQAKSFEISMEILLNGYYRGFRITEVPTVWKERTKGRSNFRVFRLVSNYLNFYLWAIAKRMFA